MLVRTICPMDFRHFDLNLIVVLDALLDERSVTGAARRLKTSQPTVSFSLQKLRDILGDPLFIRTARGMEPTPRALEMRDAVRSVLATVEDQLLSARTFDPATSDIPVTVSTSDVGELVFLPKLLRHLRAIAPQMTVRSVTMGPQRLAEALAGGQVDLALGYFPDLAGGIYQQGLFEHPFACLVRGDHPTIGSTLSLEEFVQAEHAVVNAEGRSQEIFENEMQARGIHRRIALSTPHFMGMPLLIATSDLIVTVPKAVATAWIGRANLKMLPPPVTVPPIALKQFWHRRFHADPRGVWLRGVIADLFMGHDPSTAPDFAAGLVPARADATPDLDASPGR